MIPPADVQALPGPALGVDAADPAVAVCAWLLTEGLRVALGRAQARRYARALPAAALAFAVALRAAWEATRGLPITTDVLLRGAGAAGVAVLGHSQIRELVKARTATTFQPPKGGPDGH